MMKKELLLLTALLTAFSVAPLHSSPPVHHRTLTPQGYSGLLSIPDAYTLDYGSFALMPFSHNTDPWLGYGHVKEHTYINAGIGFFPYTELSGTYLAGSYLVREPGGGDLSFNVKLTLPVDTFYSFLPRLAFGARDFIGREVVKYLWTWYGVATKQIGPLQLSLGYAGGKTPMEGIFAGVRYDALSWASVLADYNGDEISGGVRINPTVRIFGYPLTVSATMESRLDSVNLSPPDMAFALSGPLDLLGGRQEGGQGDKVTGRQGEGESERGSECARARESEEGQGDKVTGRQGEGESERGSECARAREDEEGQGDRATGRQGEGESEGGQGDKATGRQGEGESEGESEGARAREEGRRKDKEIGQKEKDGNGCDVKGGEVQVLRYDTADAHIIIENDRYKWTHLDAVGEALEWADENKINPREVTVCRNGIALKQVSVDTVGVMGKITDADFTLKPQSHNFSLRLGIKPEPIVFLGTELGPFDMLLNLDPTLSVDMWRGGKLSLRYSVPVWWTENFDDNRTFSNLRHKRGVREALLSQTFPLRPDLLARVTAGLYEREFWGAGAYLHQTLPSHNLDLTARGGVFYSPDWKYYSYGLITARYTYSPLGLRPGITAGKFWYGDKGFTIHCDRIFDVIGLRFFYKNTWGHYNDPDRLVRSLGMEATVPLTLRKEVKIGPVQIGFDEHFRYWQQSSIPGVGQEMNNVNPYVAREVEF